MMVHSPDMNSILGMENYVDTGKGLAFWYKGLGKASPLLNRRSIE